MRILVGYPAGIAPDIFTRLAAQGLSERLGQQFIVDNRPGANSNIATEMVVRAVPDGYTLLTMTATNAINATLYEGHLTFDLLRDLAPVGGLMRSASVVQVTPSLPVKPLPNSSPMPRPIPASSTMPRPAPAAPPMWPASCSIPWPESSSCTSPITPIICPI